MQYFKIKTPIIRTQYEKTSSSKFKGILEFIVNEHGIIIDWKIFFNKVFLDLYTTPSWFKDKNAGYSRREKLFEELGMKQISRPDDKKNKITELNKEQISIVNNFINNRSKYNSTIKNIVQLLKGNNPGGQAKNPGSAELILDNDSNANVFAILFDNLCLKKTQKESRRNLFDVYSIGAEEKSFESFVNLNSTLKKAFEYMQVSKDPAGFKIYLEQIETYYKKHNLVVQEVERIIKKARSKYSVNIDNTITKLPFALKDKAQFQKAHIIDVHKLKMLIIEAKQENKGFEKWLNIIEDPQNFLPLPESLHRKFDQNHVTYDENGELILINSKSKEFFEKMIGDKFKKIDLFFLTKQRKKYIRQRNANLSI